MPEIDIYRDSALRYLGYSNEVGESFRPIVHVNWVRFSYAIAGAYVLADSLDKANRMSKREFNNPREKRNQIAIAAGDSLAWQTLASIAIPGYTINRICALTYFTLKKLAKKKIPKIARKWITVAVGLSSIPFIIHPIDNLVTQVMDSTVRKYYDN